MATMTVAEAKDMLERVIMSARACQSSVALIRATTFVDVLKATGGTLIVWSQDRSGEYRPMFTGRDGTTWVLEVSPELHAQRRLKSGSIFSRDLLAVPAREAAHA